MNDDVVLLAVHIVPYLKKYKANPCTGQPLDAKGLIKLKYQKNAAGEFHCPVMYKVRYLGRYLGRYSVNFIFCFFC